MATSSKCGTKRKVLSLEERVKVIERAKNNELARSIAKAFEVGKTQIQNIIANKSEILKSWEDGIRGERKYVKPRRSLYADVNGLVWDWFVNARARNIPVTGKLIQEKASLLSEELNHEGFAASNGWLESWRKRFGVRSAALSGESASVREEDVADWSKRLPTICTGYEARNIFNADETGLFYRCLPNRSMVQKADSCKGGKNAKERVTVLLGSSVIGEKLKPLVIGKAANPRCFKGINKGTLGVHYESNCKAWMTASLFREWLERLNQRFIQEKRHILLFIDNCTAHPEVQLSNIKLVFLPPNTTS